MAKIFPSRFQRRAFSDPDEDAIFERLVAGEPIVRLAKELQTSRQTIYRAYQRARARKGDLDISEIRPAERIAQQKILAFDDKEAAEIFDRYQDGVTIRRIARDKQSCYVTIRKVINREAARRGIELEKQLGTEAKK